MRVVTCLLLAVAAAAGSGCDSSSGTADDGGGGCGTRPACTSGMTCCAGTCVFLADDVAHCGACGHSCLGLPGVESAVCSLGTCAIGKCAPGRGDCDGQLASGCEADLTGKGRDCGACGVGCPERANRTYVCRDSACVASACKDGFGDCDGDSANGCEHDLRSDPMNCGECGLRCQVDHATAACAKGLCTVGACDAGWLDCNGSPDDGCEANPMTDRAHCGRCGNPCPGNLVCGGGACVALYSPSGPQTSVPVASLTGWSECYRGAYDSADRVAEILHTCSKPKLMLACRQAGSSTLSLLAWAPRPDVLTDTGSGKCGNIPVHSANGTDFYFNGNWSWGFAVQGDGVNLCPADTGVGQHAEARLSWTTSKGALDVGFRCGVVQAVDKSWERLVYQAE